MSMERRNFFAALVAGGADIRDTRLRGKRKPVRENQRLYHGPMVIPEDVAEAVRESPDIYRTRHAGKLVSRYVDHDATVWLFRVLIPVSRQMVGEVIRTPDGRRRVHCWAAATPANTYPLARELHGLDIPAELETTDINQYLDPQYAQQLMAESLSDDLRAMPLPKPPEWRR